MDPPYDARMPGSDAVEAYLADVPEPGQATLRQLRADLRAALPDAEEAMAYGCPAFKVGGKTVAGFAAHTKHLSYLPHSGTVTAVLAAELAGYDVTKGSVKFAPDEPLPAELVGRLVQARLTELGLG